MAVEELDFTRADNVNATSFGWYLKTRSWKTEMGIADNIQI